MTCNRISDNQLIYVFLYVNSMYSVLEFVQERSVAVVPDSWVERTSEGHFCYWPPKNKQKLIQRGSLPDKALWKKLEVRVFKSSVDYKTAHQLMRKAENTSCLEESDGSGKKLREKRPPSRYLCYTSASEDDDSFQPTKGPKVQARSPPRLSDFLAQTRCALYQDMERGLDMAREPASLPNWSEIPVVVGRELEMAQRPPIQPERPPQRDKAVMRSQPGSNAADIEAHISETLKHAPGIARRKGNPLANSDPVESESPSYNFFTST
ncbi:uncharacterized protein [Hoplias malabaricus]|uniref:uncharacterized protein isoform X5 n=1 Tax=Hoplias malabaricus TaxID=27720 RepID=UPI0034620DB6